MSVVKSIGLCQVSSFAFLPSLFIYIFRHGSIAKAGILFWIDKLSCESPGSPSGLCLLPPSVAEIIDVYCHDRAMVWVLGSLF